MQQTYRHRISFSFGSPHVGKAAFDKLPASSSEMFFNFGFLYRICSAVCPLEMHFVCINFPNLATSQTLEIPNRKDWMLASVEMREDEFARSSPLLGLL
jgi:hypothetical protein